jgi:hypothetical protein
VAHCSFMLIFNVCQITMIKKKSTRNYKHFSMCSLLLCALRVPNHQKLIFAAN